MIYFWIDPGGLSGMVFATFKLTTSVLRAAVRARVPRVGAARLITQRWSYAIYTDWRNRIDLQRLVIHGMSLLLERGIARFSAYSPEPGSDP
jgi:hypothetical protein